MSKYGPGYDALDPGKKDKLWVLIEVVAEMLQIAADKLNLSEKEMQKLTDLIMSSLVQIGKDRQGGKSH